MSRRKLAHPLELGLSAMCLSMPLIFVSELFYTVTLSSFRLGPEFVLSGYRCQVRTRVIDIKSCLVVDDSKVVRRVARKILEELDFSVDEAADGQIALDHCVNAMPDAILLDWNMPVMNGIEFLRELRVREDGDQPIVGFCSTENDINFIQEAISAGANEYIMKPFDREIVQSKFAPAGIL